MVPSAPSLTRRITLAMAAFGCAVACVFMVSALVLFDQTEDEVLYRFVEVETDRVLEERSESGELVASSPRFHVYTAASLPGELRARFGAREAGVFEADIDGREHVVLVRNLPANERLYVTFDIDGIEPNDTRYATVVLLLGLAVAACIVLATLLLGRALATSVVRPVRELADVVASDSPEPLSQRLRAQDCDRELQALVLSLAANLETIEAYRRRERNFTRYASHELRSPIAAIQGASELLRAAPEQRLVLLDRIDRGVESMRAMVDTFLWLARAPNPQPDPPISIRASIERVISAQSGIAKRLGVELTSVVQEDARVSAPSAALEIAVSNLVANAISFASKQPVSVHADSHGVTIEDRGRGMSEAQLEASMSEFVRADESAGYGLGLPIADAICERLGWTLSMTSKVGEGTIAHIAFRATSMDKAP